MTKIYFSMDSVGHRIKLKRQKMRLHQAEIAIMLGKGSKQVISNWENDKAEPSLADLRKLAEMLETTVGYLAGGDEPDTAVTLSKAGYVLMSTDEVIAMQRELLELKKRK